MLQAAYTTSKTSPNPSTTNFETTTFSSTTLIQVESTSATTIASSSQTTKTTTYRDTSASTNAFSKWNDSKYLEYCIFKSIFNLFKMYINTIMVFNYLCLKVFAVRQYNNIIFLISDVIDADLYKLKNVYKLNFKFNI